MSITRRLLLSILAGGCALVIPPSVGWTAVPEPEAKPRMPAFGIPRGVAVEMNGPVKLPGHCHAKAFSDPCLGHLNYSLIDGVWDVWVVRTMISTGRELIPWDSPEGQAIANETAVNLRSDGTIRHRQHHWPR